MMGNPPRQGIPALWCALVLRIIPLKTKKVLVRNVDVGHHVCLRRADPIDFRVVVHRLVVEALCDLFVEIQSDHIPFAQARRDAQADADVAIFDIGRRLLALSYRLHDRACKRNVIPDKNCRVFIVLGDDFLI